MILSVDFETRSTVDLRRTGVYPYATDPTTDIWCMAYAFEGEEPGLWYPGIKLADMRGGTGRDILRIDQHIRDSGELRAWNAGFERLIWHFILGPRYGWVVPDREQWFDTAADAAALALPRALNRAALVLGLDEEKDDEGYRLMMKMSKPRDLTDDGEPVWWDDEKDLQRLYEYCKQDVRVERAVAERIRPIGDYERRVYLLTELMNDRGVLIDTELAGAAQEIVEEGTRRANRELEAITDGDVERFTQVQRLKSWLEVQGVELDDLRKQTLKDLLGEDELPDDVRRAVEIRAESAKSSTAKITSMFEYACADDRARGMVMYHGAGTGRWSGKGPQPQNYPRPEIDDPEQYMDLVLAGDYDALEEHHPPLIIVSSLLRSMLRAAPGTRFVNGDFSQIEARVLAWIAEQNDLVEMFAAGDPVYEVMAAHIYGVPVQEIVDEYALGKGERRKMGKDTILGCGFQMGAATFARQAWERGGVVVEDEMAERAVEAYREKNHRIKSFWYEINDAAMAAVASPGEVHEVGREGKVRYVVRGQFLWCILPSGRPLAYAKPELVRHTVTPPEGDPFETTSVCYMSVNSTTRKWSRHYGYGGLWTENVVQAMARDLIAGAMLRLEEAGYPTVLTVHDEVMAEVPYGQGSLDEFLEIMRQRPRWAHGLPIEVEGYEHTRYKK